MVKARTLTRRRESLAARTAHLLVDTGGGARAKFGSGTRTPRADSASASPGSLADKRGLELDERSAASPAASPQMAHPPSAAGGKSEGGGGSAANFMSLSSLMPLEG